MATLNIDLDLGLYEAGVISKDLLVCFLVKQIAGAGVTSAFDDIPDWLLDAVRERLNRYSVSKAWLVVSSEGEEDYSLIADKALSLLEKYQGRARDVQVE